MSSELKFSGQYSSLTLQIFQNMGFTSTFYIKVYLSLATDVLIEGELEKQLEYRTLNQKIYIMSSELLKLYQIEDFESKLWQQFNFLEDKKQYFNMKGYLFCHYFDNEWDFL